MVQTATKMSVGAKVDPDWELKMWLESISAEALFTEEELYQVSAETPPEEGPEILVLAILSAAIFIVALAIIWLAYFVLSTCRIGFSKIPIAGNVVKQVMDPALNLCETVMESVELTALAAVQEVVKPFAWLIWHVISALGFATLKAVKTEISGMLQPWINSFHGLQKVVSNLESLVSNPKTGLRVKTATLTAENAALQKRVAHLESVVSGLSGETAPVTAASFRALQVRVNTLAESLQSAQKALNSVRTAEGGVSTGLKTQGLYITKIEHEITTIQEQIKALPKGGSKGVGITAQELTQLHHADAVATKLEPLAPIAGLSALGIATLEALGTDPCLCLSLSGLDGPLLAALEADQVIAHGV